MGRSGRARSGLALAAAAVTAAASDARAPPTPTPLLAVTCAAGAMAFFQRVMNYLLNEVLVNGLANRCGRAGCVCQPAAPAKRPRADQHAPRPAPNTLPACLPPTPPLARCSRTFQRFAIRSSKAMEEVAKKGVEHKEALGAAAQEHGPRLGAFWQTFRQEMTKGLKVGGSSSACGLERRLNTWQPGCCCSAAGPGRSPRRCRCVPACRLPLPLYSGAERGCCSRSPCPAGHQHEVRAAPRPRSSAAPCVVAGVPRARCPVGARPAITSPCLLVSMLLLL